MISTPLAVVSTIVLLSLALFFALIDVAFDYFSKISLRTYREDSWKAEFLTRSLEDPMSLLLPLRIGLQSAFIAITVLVTMLYMSSEAPQPLVAAFVTMLIVFLVFREAVPNIVARKNPERILLVLLPAFRLYSRLVTPISHPLSKIVGVFVRVDEAETEKATQEEVRAYIEAGEDEGILEGDEGRMVQSIVHLDDTVVREVMTPRPEIVAIRKDAKLAELRALFAEEKYSRVPVYSENLDHVDGLVYAIDLVAAVDADLEDPLAPLVREVSFVPESKKVGELLREFQRGKQTIAVVVDEYGGVSGLVTVEDILEEIVGEIHDEFDEVDQGIVKEKDGVFLVSGRADIDDVSEELDLEVESSGFETVSGYVLEALGHIPRPGEVIEREGVRIEVVDADDQRIHKVRFRIPKPGPVA